MLGHLTCLDEKYIPDFRNNITTYIFLTVEWVYCKCHTKALHQRTQPIWILPSQAQTAGTLPFYSWNFWCWNIHVSPFLSPLCQSGSIKQTNRNKNNLRHQSVQRVPAQIAFPTRESVAWIGPRLIQPVTQRIKSFEMDRLEYWIILSIINFSGYIFCRVRYRRLIIIIIDA